MDKAKIVTVVVITLIIIVVICCCSSCMISVMVYKPEDPENSKEKVMRNIVFLEAQVLKAEEEVDIAVLNTKKPGDTTKEKEVALQKIQDYQNKQKLLEEEKKKLMKLEMQQKIT